MGNVKEVVLFSGGMDSLIGWAYVGKPPALFFLFGTGYGEQEHKRAFRIADMASMDIQSCFELEWLGAYERPEQKFRIPLRNALMAQVAALRGYEKIWVIGQQSELSIPDRCVRFYAEFSDFLTWQMDDGRKYVVDTPFRKMDKTDMVGWFLREYHTSGKTRAAAQDEAKELLRMTWSCYRPVKQLVMRYEGGFDERLAECGNCPACFRKAVALYLNDVLIPEDFAQHPLISSTAAEYYRRRGEYDEKRRTRIEAAVQPFMAGFGDD